LTKEGVYLPEKTYQNCIIMGARNLNLTALMRAAKRRKLGNRRQVDEDSYYEELENEERFENYNCDRDDEDYRE